VLILAGQDENLYGFHPEGNLAFRTEMPGQMLGSPVIDRNGHVYVGISVSQRGQQPRGALVCVDGNSHKIRWEYKAADAVESTPVIGDDDVIYFGDNAGVIHAVDFRGAAAWTAEVECAVRSAGTIVGPQRVAFGLDNQTLVVLRCSSRGLAAAGWPKLGRTLGQNGLA
jgi:outer membrane protein assembly factor BamB